MRNILIMLMMALAATAFAQDTTAMAAGDTASALADDNAKQAVEPENTADGLAGQANAAYQKDDFNRALQLYQQAEKEEGTSSVLFYNMGNTYYRLGNMGKAVLYYERALLLDPSNDDARTNLEFVNDKLQLKIDRGSSFVSDTIGGFVRSIASDTWAHIGIGSFILFLLAVVVYIFADAVALRKIGFFGGGALLLMSIVSNICAFYTHSIAVNKSYAIVTIPSATLSTSPRVPKDKSEEAFMLNEGTKIEIIDSVESSVGGEKVMWLDVKADEQHRAWIRSTDVEQI